MADLILGISAFYHDSAAVVTEGPKILAAAQEERFTRKKQDASFPSNAVKYVLDEAGIAIDDLTAIAFYEKPLIKFERLLETYHAFAPRGLKSFLMAIPVWLKEKLFLKKIIADELTKLGALNVPILFPEHHLSHAASAFFPSPFQEAAILTVDGVGEWATCTIGKGTGNKIEIFSELNFPHSIGLLYSAFTYYCGFKVNSGEYKLMGLAPYGISNHPQTHEFIQTIREQLVDIRDDGSILLNMNYFDFATGDRMTNDKKWQKLFGMPPRQTESHLTQPYMNLALAIQEVTEEIMLKLATTAKELSQSDYLVLAGGVALNSVANGKLLESGLFKDIWIQPAAGDAGGALGAACATYYIWKNNERKIIAGLDSMQGGYLGPEFSPKDITKTARKYRAPYRYVEDFDQLCDEVAGLLNEGKIAGWFQGRMEYGPRALGNRSILGDARLPEMQKKMNLKIKYREGFRPFAPTVLEEDIREFFEIPVPSPYMLFVVPVNQERRKPLPEGYETMALFDKLYHLRSDIPAVTHIDFSARLQSVNRDTNPRYWKLINAFKEKTGYGLVVNTSFNVRGEPIVCTPEDAYKCFMRTEIDVLVMDRFLFFKEDQPHFDDKTQWMAEFELD
ncbi:MAG: carbamoyltransferase [bacterium]|nr:carbamoyltransferase [bacterium]